MTKLNYNDNLRISYSFNNKSENLQQQEFYLSLQQIQKKPKNLKEMYNNSGIRTKLTNIQNHAAKSFDEIKQHQSKTNYFSCKLQSNILLSGNSGHQNDKKCKESALFNQRKQKLSFEQIKFNDKNNTESQKLTSVLRRLLKNQQNSENKSRINRVTSEIMFDNINRYSEQTCPDNVVIKLGDQNNLPRKHSVLSKKSLNNSRSSLKLSASRNFKHIFFNKKHNNDPQKEEFYIYCQNQITKITNENVRLKQLLAKQTSKTRELEQKNSTLKSEDITRQLNQLRRQLHDKNKQIQCLKRQSIKVISQKAVKMQQKMQYISSKKAQLERQLINKGQLIIEKDTKINELMNQIRNLNLKEMKNILNDNSTLKDNLFHKSASIQNILTGKQQYRSIVNLLEMDE